MEKKVLTHDPNLGSDGDSRSTAPVKKSAPAASDTAAPAPAQAPTSTFGSAVISPSKGKISKPLQPLSKGGPVEFRMESGSGRERTFLVRAATRASVSRLWETITGYDHLKQFLPDTLTSDREGQDGAAAIVHLVCLTHYAIFVYKVNLHLRVIEHPREHTLEFERIAGDYESFRGSIEISEDPATHDAVITFRGTLVPTGHTMNMTLEKMARRLLIPQMEAVRAKAEGN